jgi:hypothetical protein
MTTPLTNGFIHCSSSSSSQEHNKQVIPMTMLILEFNKINCSLSSTPSKVNNQTFATLEILQILGGTKNTPFEYFFAIPQQQLFTALQSTPGAQGLAALCVAMYFVFILQYTKAHRSLVVSMTTKMVVLQV